MKHKKESDEHIQALRELAEEGFYEHHRFTADPGQEMLRVDKFLINRLPNTSRNRIQNAAKAGCILVDNKPVKSNYKVKPGQQISLVLPEPPRNTELIAENIPLEIVHEDEELLIVNKKAGMVVHPGYANYTGTLVNALMHHISGLPESSDETPRPGLVHRIDKDTSGLLVIAKTEWAMTHLARQFFDHSIERSYRALVWGRPEPAEGTLTGYMARSPKDRRIMAVFNEDDKGKKAITHYRVLEQFAYASLIECRLETGRTHQIRAHMKHAGHPVFNDPAYGGNKILQGPAFNKYKQFIQNCFDIFPTQALHAKTLGFKHPANNEKVYFEAPLPAPFEEVLEKWRKTEQFG